MPDGACFQVGGLFELLCEISELLPQLFYFFSERQDFRFEERDSMIA
jgi:hypothetical protein